jgi:tRNA threonylcarbamoyladenosine biosynthesis protein TsaB
VSAWTSGATRATLPVADNRAMSCSTVDPPRSKGQPLRLLALETSTDSLSVALGTGLPGERVWQHTGPGGAQASATLLPLLQDVLSQAGWTLQSLDAVVFGRGPGSFTGLRTACAVAQGLAYGAQTSGRPGGVPVLAVDTLLALAEEARAAAAAEPGQVVVALLDARMDELYVAPYAIGPQGLQALAPPHLCAPQHLGAHLAQCLPADAGFWAGRCLLAGNVFDSCGERMADVPGPRVHALPTATALLRLAPGLLLAGAAVAAQDALPLYVRDKVAQTTVERDLQRLAAAAVAPAA